MKYIITFIVAFVVVFIIAILQCNRNYKEAFKVTMMYLILVYGWIGLLYGIMYIGKGVRW